MPTIKEIKSVLALKCVGIAGAGGLGSNVAAMLIRSGVGKLIIADFDTVSLPNLGRQFFFKDQIGMAKVEALRDNLLRIEPDAVLQMHCVKVSPENIPLLFSTCDAVVEALDEASEKMSFIGEMTSVLPEIPLVAGSGLGGTGGFERISVVRSGNLFICGDFESEVSETMPPMAPKVTAVAALQADTVVRILKNSNAV